MILKQTFEPSIEKRITGLDELRGIAVILVMIDHGNILFSKTFHPLLLLFGYVGVDLFFIISGYLIAFILMKSVAEENYFKKFYVRRVFRIWPLSFVFIVLSFSLAYITGEFQNAATVLPFYLFFLQNYIVPFNWGQTLPLIPHFWSLAIEEQFYLFLPFIFFLVPKNRWSFIILSIGLLSLIGRFFFSHTESDLNFYYTNIKQTYFRVHYLGLGVMLALTEMKKILIIFFLGWLFLLLFFFPGNGLLELPITLVSVYLVWKCIIGQSLINSIFLARFGKICFGLYIIHFPIARLLSEYTQNQPLYIQLASFLVYVGVTYILSVASFKYFEIPIQNLRTKYEK